MNEKNEQKDKKTLSYWIGHIVGTALIACLAICVIAIAVALTAKFIFWLI